MTYKNILSIKFTWNCQLIGSVMMLITFGNLSGMMTFMMENKMRGLLKVSVKQVRSTDQHCSILASEKNTLRITLWNSFLPDLFEVALQHYFQCKYVLLCLQVNKEIHLWVFFFVKSVDNHLILWCIQSLWCIWYMVFNVIGSDFQLTPGYSVQKFRKKFYMSGVQVTFELYGHFWCLHVLYSK